VSSISGSSDQSSWRPEVTDMAGSPGDSGTLAAVLGADDDHTAHEMLVSAANFETSAGLVRHDAAGIDEYARVAPLHHRLTQGRLASLAKTLQPQAGATALGRVGAGVDHPHPAAGVLRDEGLIPAPSIPIGRSGSSGKDTGVEGAVRTRKKMKSHLKRGSVPYSVIAAHLEADLALPPRARGHDTSEVDDDVDVPQHGAIGFSRNATLESMPSLETIGEPDNALAEVSVQAVRNGAIAAD